jgi:hypothetical protein
MLCFALLCLRCDVDVVDVVGPGGGEGDEWMFSVLYDTLLGSEE